MSSDAEILNEIISALNLNGSEFARATGIPQSNVSEISRGIKTITPKIRRKALDAFPSINPDYLHNGVGSVLKEGVALSKIQDVGRSVGAVVRLVSGHANAGKVTGEYFSGDIEAHLSAPFLPSGKYWGARVSGNSMEPTIQHGGIVVVPDAQEQIPLDDGCIYLVITEGMATIKRVTYVLSGENAGLYKLTPDNPKHDTIFLSKHDIRQVWRVVFIFQPAV